MLITIAPAGTGGGDVQKLPPQSLYLRTHNTFLEVVAAPDEISTTTSWSAATALPTRPLRRSSSDPIICSTNSIEYSASRVLFCGSGELPPVTRHDDTQRIAEIHQVVTSPTATTTNTSVYSPTSYVTNIVTSYNDPQPPSLDAAINRRPATNPSAQSTTRAIEQSQHTSHKVFVGGLSTNTNDHGLFLFMSQFGPVRNATVKRNPVTGASKRYAYVKFYKAPDPSILEKKHAWILDGQQIRITKYQVSSNWKKHYYSEEDINSDDEILLPQEEHLLYPPDNHRDYYGFTDERNGALRSHNATCI